MSQGYERDDAAERDAVREGENSYVVDEETGEIVAIEEHPFPPNVDPVPMAPSQEVAVRPQAAPPGTLFGTDDPTIVLQKAAALAVPLAELINKMKLFTMIGGKKHVEVEGWTTLGSMLGVFPVLESCDPVELGGVKGFVAVVSAQTRDGAIVGRAQSYCMRSESKWKSSPTYAVASMAQTRATSKALRMPLGFIMQLAGYEPTPASEREVETVSAGGGGEGNATGGSGTGSPDPSRPGTIAEAIARVEQGLVLLKDNPIWQLDSVLAQASVQWNRPITKLEDLKLSELNEIIQGMRDHGKIEL